MLLLRHWSPIHNLNNVCLKNCKVAAINFFFFFFFFFSFWCLYCCMDWMFCAWLRHWSPSSALLFTIWTMFALKTAKFAAFNFCCYFFYLFYVCIVAQIQCYGCDCATGLPALLFFSQYPQIEERKKLLDMRRAPGLTCSTKTFLGDNTCADENCQFFLTTFSFLL